MPSSLIEYSFSTALYSQSARIAFRLITRYDFLADLDEWEAGGPRRIELIRNPLLCRFVGEIVVDVCERNIVFGEIIFRLSTPWTSGESIHDDLLQDDLLSIDVNVYFTGF